MHIRKKSTSVECCFDNKHIVLEELDVVVINFPREELAAVDITKFGTHIADYDTLKELIPEVTGQQFRKYANEGYCFVIPNQETIEAIEEGNAKHGAISVRKILKKGNGHIFEADTVFVKLMPGVKPSSMKRTMEAKGLEFCVKQGYAKNLYLYKTTGNYDVFALSLELTQDPRVEYAEPDFEFIPVRQYAPTEPFYPLQWHLNNAGAHTTNTNPNGGIGGKVGADVRVEEAWDLLPSTGGIPNAGNNIRIAAIEFGFDVNHPDLQPIQGISANFVQTVTQIGINNVPLDLDGLGYDHGTVVAGMFGARNLAAGGVGGVGAAYNCDTIMLSISFPATAATYLRAVGYAADPRSVAEFATTTFPTGTNVDGADILTMSTSLNGFSVQSVGEVVDFATKFGRDGKGMVILASVDNAFVPVADMPGGAMRINPKVIAVGNIAANDRGVSSAYSTGPDELDFVASGWEIFSTQYVLSSGPPFSDDPTFVPSFLAGLTNPYLTPLNTNGNPILVPEPELDPAIPIGYISNTSGTSFATPLSAGVVALLLSMEPKLSFWEIKQLLQQSTDKVDLGFDGLLSVDFDEGPNQRDLSWFTSGTGGGTNLVNTRRTGGTGHLTLAGQNSTLMNPVVGNQEDVAPNLIHGTNKITVNEGNTNVYVQGQALLVGKQTTLTAIPNSATPNTIQVVNTNDFQDGMTVVVGSQLNTYISTDLTNAPLNILAVTSHRGFQVGDVIRAVGGENGAADEIFTVTAVSVSGGGFPFLGIFPARTERYGSGDLVEMANKEELVIAAGGVGASSLTFTTPLSFDTSLTSPHVVGTSVEIKGTEVAVIEEVIDANTLRVSSLFNGHAAGTPIYGGLIPDYSQAYGYGRLNAFKAVQNGGAFTHHLAHADLIIRDTAVDDGVTNQAVGTVIDSPDIWVRNTDPSNDPGGDPGDGVTVGPHQEPFAEEDRYVYVRVKNIGAQANFEATVQVYLALSAADGSDTFDYPVTSIIDEDDNPVSWVITEQDDQDRDRKDIRDGEKGIYLLHEQTIPAGAITAAGGGMDWNTFNFKWRKKDVPPEDSQLKTHLLVQISPFDGIKCGGTVLENNNLSYKEVELRDRIKFKNTFTGGLLEDKIEVGNYNPPTTMPFCIDIEDQTDDFTTEETEIIVTRRNKNAANDKVRFYYDGSMWTFEGGTPDWLTVADPVLDDGSGNPGAVVATGQQNHIYFQGTFDTTTTQKTIKFEVKVNDTGTPAFKDSHTIKFKFDFDEGTGFGSNKGARFHFFTTTTGLEQTAGKEFGPLASDPTKKYRVTSLHKNTSAAFVPALAVCDGIVCIQEHTVNNNLVNLILKPIQQPGFNFAPIKYIIYKGIKKSSLINGALIADRTKNRLTESIWDSQDKANDSIQAKNMELGNPVPGDVDPPKEALGIHLVPGFDTAGTYDDDQPIDNLFFREDDDIQLPLVRGGWDIGEFDDASVGTGEFGLEIIFDSVHYKPTIGITRSLDHLIESAELTGTETDAVKLENAFEREEVLNYIDPCAFFGSFFNDKLFALDVHPDPEDAVNNPLKSNDFDKKKKGNIYDDVLVVNTGTPAFINVNKTYIDIRNEYKHSMNLFGNYRNDIATSIQNNPLGGTDVSLRSTLTSGWPILILDDAIYTVGNSKNKEVFPIAFPVSNEIGGETGVELENPLPLVYIAQGYRDKGLFPFKELKAKKKFVELMPGFKTGTEELSTGFTTETLDIALPNVGSSATTVVSSYVRLVYLKRFEDNTPTGYVTPQSSGIVFRAANPLDNLFCPLDLEVPIIAQSGAGNSSVVYDDEVYIDATNSDVMEMDFIGKVGFSQDTLNVSMFTYAYDIRDKKKTKSNKPFGLIGKNGNADDAIKEVSNQHDNIEVFKEDLLISGSPEPIVIVEDVSEDFSGFEEVDPNELLFIILTQLEYDQILALIQDPLNFDSEKFPVRLGMVVSGTGADDNGTAFTEYDLVLRGYLLSGSAYQINEVNTTIKIRTNGNF